MLESIGTVAICAAALWGARYVWNFWQYRKSIGVVEALAISIKEKADFAAARTSPEEAESTYLIAALLKGVADSLSYGKLANPEVAGAQLRIVEGMIASPDDISFYTGQPMSSVTDIRLGLLRARESFVLLHQAHGTASLA